MLAAQLMELIACHSERLSEELFQRFVTAAQYSDLQKIPARQLRVQALQVCRDFADWIRSANDKDLEDRYIRLGVDRQSQGVSLSHLVAAIHLTRDQMLGCARRSPAISTEDYIEFTSSLGEFFDRAVCATIIGYERGQAQERYQLRAS
jgi:hypothetical protein